MIAERAKKKQAETLKQNISVNQKSDERREVNTAKELAKVAGVSHDTIHKVEVIEVQIGRMLKEIPKATPNNNPHHENHMDMNLVKTKSEAVQELGFSRNQVSQFQRMADHEQQSAGQNKTSVKLSKTGNYQFGCQK